MPDINEILQKFSEDIVKNINIKNVEQIIVFLQTNNCDYCEELLEDYLDLFIIEIDEFKLKFKTLNSKYNNSFLEYAKNDMNLFEKFYN
ncbi:MAG: hypothetical protein ACK5HP_00670 [Bacilli bacterium]